MAISDDAHGSIAPLALPASENVSAPPPHGSKKKVPSYYHDNMTERSIKFHDGTYTLDRGRGFWDEFGGYHAWGDCDDPEARGPTPAPTLPLEEGEEVIGGGGEANDLQDEENGVVQSEIEDVEFWTAGSNIITSAPHNRFKVTDSTTTVAALNLSDQDSEESLSDVPANLSDGPFSPETRNSTIFIKRKTVVEIVHNTPIAETNLTAEIKTDGIAAPKTKAAAKVVKKGIARPVVKTKKNARGRAMPATRRSRNAEKEDGECRS